MNSWDYYSRPRRADEELRRALVEARRTAEQAVAERDAAEQRAVDAEQRASDAESRAARMTADLVTVRRNRDDEIARARDEERSAAVESLASVRDDLVRSLDANSDRESPWYLGHQAILARVRQAIRAAGAVEVGSVGERFDPSIHEAIGTAPGAPGTVVSVDRVGYRLGDGRLVRPAQVHVAA